MLKNLIKDNQGAILAEYGLLVTLIAVACVVAVTLLGTSVRDLYDSVAF